MKRTAGLKPVINALRARAAKPPAPDPTAFHEAARAQIVCAVCSRGGPFHAHHVVDKNWLKRHHRKPLNDPRNALRLCIRCHTQHEFGGPGKVDVPKRRLTAGNVCYAYEVMGLAASVYLERHYTGLDYRVALHEDEACPRCQ